MLTRPGPWRLKYLVGEWECVGVRLDILFQLLEVGLTFPEGPPSRLEGGEKTVGTVGAGRRCLDKQARVGPREPQRTETMRVRCACVWG